MIQKCEDGLVPEEVHQEEVRLSQQEIVDKLDETSTEKETDVMGARPSPDENSSAPLEMAAKGKPSSSSANQSNTSNGMNANVPNARPSNIDNQTTKELIGETSIRQPADGPRQDAATNDAQLQDRKGSASSDRQSKAVSSVSFGEAQKVVSREKSDDLSNGAAIPKESEILKPMAKPSAPVQKLEVPTSSNLKSDVGTTVDSTNNAIKQAEPINSQSTNDEKHKPSENEKKTHKPKEGPTSMQTLLVPKIDEPQGQDKSHSTDAAGKHEKLVSKPSSDVAKTLSDTKKLLKPTRIKVS